MFLGWVIKNREIILKIPLFLTFKPCSAMPFFYIAAGQNTIPEKEYLKRYVCGFSSEYTGRTIKGNRLKKNIILRSYAVEIRAAIGSTLDLMISTLRVG
jgi:hypothetical protein